MAKPIGFSPKDARRVARTVQRVESTPWSPNAQRTPANTFAYGVLRAKCTTAIPSGTWDSPSDAGEVQVYHLNRQTDEWEASGDPQQVYNDHVFDDDVAEGTTCKVAWISGQLWLVQADC